MIRLWLRLEAGRRGRPLVLLTVLVAVSTAALLATVDGARRGATAVDRLVARTAPATAVVRLNDPEHDRWPQVRELPEVAALTTFPGYSGFSVDQAPGEPRRAFLPLDDDAMRTLERPVVLAGRLYDPLRPDEAVVTARFVERHGLGVGDVVTVRLFSAYQVDSGISGVRTTTVPRPGGPAVATRIVGVVRSPWFSDLAGGEGRLVPSPALGDRYGSFVLGANQTGEKWALVRLRGGDADLPALRAGLARLTGGSSVDVLPQSQAIAQLRSVARFQAAGLLGLAGAVLLAGVFVLGAATARQASAAGDDAGVLPALGATPRQAGLLAALGPAVAGAVGAVLGGFGAIGLSAWTPYGVAAALEPDPGIHVAWAVLLPGVPLVALAVAAWSYATARLASAAAVPRNRPSRVAQAVGRAGLPVPVTIGTRYALESGRDRVPVRSGLVGVAAGVLGVVAAATFGAGVQDAAAPARFGQDHQLVLALGYLDSDQGVDTPAAIAAVRADPAVAATSDLRFQPAQLPDLDTGPAGDRTLTVFSAPGEAPATVLRGRLPAGPGELLLGVGSARRLGADIGSGVRLQGAAGELDGVVTGVGLVPQTEYNEYDAGAWLTPAGYDRLGTGYLNRELLIRLVPGAEPVAVAARLRATMEPIRNSQFLFLDRALEIRRAAEVQDLRVLPGALATFLALLALTATAHVLVTSVRRRSSELAVLRALGMTRRQVRAATAVQAAVPALAGLLVGLPLGIAAGRVLWRLVAGLTPVEYRPPLDLAVVGLVAVVTTVAVQLLAAPVAGRAVRARPAQVLRAE